MAKSVEQRKPFHRLVRRGLSEKGVSEAKAAGKLLKEEGYSFDFAYTSVLKRAIHTLWNVLDELDQASCPLRNPGN